MKLFKWLGKLVGFVLLLAIVILGVAIYFLYDGNNQISEEYQYPQGTIEEQTNKLMVKALSNTKNDSHISITFDSHELNSFLSVVTKEVNDKTNSLGIKVEGIELTLNEEGSIEVYSYLNIIMFPASLKGVATITTTDDFIIIKIEKISLSKISLDNSTVSSIVTKYINSEKVNETLSNNGIDLNVDLKTLSIKLDLQKMVNAISENLKSSSQGELYSSLFDLAIEEKILEFDFNTDQKIGLKINLTDLSYDENRDGVIPVDYQEGYATAKQMMTVLVNSGVVDYSNSSKVFYYLINGYDKIKEEEGFEFIDSLDLSSVGITKNTEYEGIRDEGVGILAIIEDQAPNLANIQTGILNFKLREENLNNILMNIDIPNATFCFYTKGETTEFSYIYLEGLYADIIENNMTLKCVINVNGKRIVITVDMAESSSSGLAINATLTNISVGNIEVSEDMETKILIFLEEVLKEEKLIKVESQTKTFKISLDSYFESSTFYNLIAAFITAETSFDEIDGESYINVNMSPSS